MTKLDTSEPSDVESGAAKSESSRRADTALSNPWSEPLSIPAPIAARATTVAAEKDKTWARLQPPAEQRARQRRVPSRKSSPSHRIPGSNSAQPIAQQIAKRGIAASTSNLISSPLASETPERRLPKVMVRVTTRSKDTAEWLRAREDDEEPTNPGVGLPTLAALSACQEIAQKTVRQTAVQEAIPGNTARSENARAPVTAAKRRRIRDRLVMQVLLNSVVGLPAALRNRLESEDNSLEKIAQASSETLASKLGTSPELARVLHETCETYSRMRETRQAQSLTHDSLQGALTEVRGHALAFRQCDEDNRSERRQLRRNLRHALTDLYLIVAERGEQGLLHDLERLSVSDRIALLSSRFQPNAGNP